MSGVRRNFKLPFLPATQAELPANPLDPVTLLLNLPQHVIANHACYRLGAVTVMNNPLYTERELEAQLNGSDARFLITLDLLLPRALKIYYTTNGTDPTESSSVYSAPIPIAVATTLKFFARDLAGNSEGVKTEIYTHILKGDINGNGAVDLTDAVMVLQVLSRVTPTQPINKNANVDGDGKIGLQEAIYILQGVAEMR